MRLSITRYQAELLWMLLDGFVTAADEPDEDPGHEKAIELLEKVKRQMAKEAKP